ncbi:MAG: 50S ribosomal protein L1 [Deinococcus sp.]|nr:50S ribosomal protein L1 [Deinococcus sp.]
MARSKRYRQLATQVDPEKAYAVAEAIALAKQLATAKFDESLEVAFKLGVDPKKGDQNVRGTVALPHGVGKTLRVVVITKAGDKASEATQAGADVVGGQELIERIAGGWMDFDAVAATPDMMGPLSAKLGKILGPRGLLPNPKAGTVGQNIGQIVSEIKAGRIEFRLDKGGVVHAPFGRASFDEKKLEENFRALFEAVERAKPATAKGVYFQSVNISSTMGPGIKVAVS